MKTIHRIFLALMILALVASCGGTEAPPTEEPAAPTEAPQLWSRPTPGFAALRGK